jgi:hypothetical protein
MPTPPDPEVHLLGTISTLTGGSITTPIDIPKNSYIFIHFDSSNGFGVTATDTGGNTYILSTVYLSAFVTTALAAGDSINIVNVPDASYTTDFFTAAIVGIVNTDPRQKNYIASPPNPNDPIVYNLLNSAGHTTPNSYSFPAATTAFNASQSIDDTKIFKTAVLSLINVSTSGALITDTKGADGFSSLYSFQNQFRASLFGSQNTGLRGANGTTALGSFDTVPTPGFGTLIVALEGLYAPFASTLTKIDCKRDEKKQRRYTAAINSLKNAIIYNDDNINTVTTSALTPVIIDAATDCDYPNIHVLKSGKLLYTYVTGGNIVYRTSSNLGKTWGAALSVATGFTAHDLDTDFAGFFPIIPAYKSSDQHLYIITGKPDGSGGITWNSPVDTGITAKEISPALVCLPDGKLELTYVDTSDAIIIARCSNMRPSGVGTWV